jgi:hypothetical protein
MYRNFCKWRAYERSLNLVSDGLKLRLIYQWVFGFDNPAYMQSWYFCFFSFILFKHNAYKERLGAHKLRNVHSEHCQNLRWTTLTYV